MATTIDPRVILADDSGTPENPVGDGTTINNDLFQQIQDAVDALFTGNFVFGGNLTLEGGNLSVVGGASVTGNATVGGALTVTGTTTLNSTGGNIVNSPLSNAIAFFIRGRSSDDISRILFQRFAGSLSQAAIDGFDGTLRISTGTALTARLTITDSAIITQNAIRFTGAITPPILTADQPNYAPANFASAYVLRLSSTAAWTITGLAGGADGRNVVLVNVGANTIDLANFAAGGTSLAQNRFFYAGGTLTLLPGDSASLLYDGIDSVWRLVARL